MRHIHLSIGSNGSIDSKLSLSKEVLEMVEQSNVDSIFHVHTLDSSHVASYFSRCLTEAHDTVVKESPGIAIGRIGVIETCTKNKKPVNQQSVAGMHPWVTEVFQRGSVGRMIQFALAVPPTLCTLF